MEMEKSGEEEGGEVEEIANEREQMQKKKKNLVWVGA